MKRVLSPQLPTPGHAIALPEMEAEHLVKVLRLREGDTLEAIDGRGHAATVVLRIKGGAVRIELALGTEIRSALEQRSAVAPLTLEMAVLKGDAMEWVVEKAVELGVERLVPTLTAHTVVQMKNKGPEVFRDRWQKIADQALKQCGRLERLLIDLPLDLESLLANAPVSPTCPRVWCDETVREDGMHLLDWIKSWDSPGAIQVSGVRLLIGPEGGWSEGEKDLLTRAAPGCHPRVSLGTLVLRAETAALFSSSLLVANLLRRTAAFT